MNNKIFSKITSGILLCTMLTYTAPVMAYTKQETVYSKVDAEGKGYETIVTSHLQNDKKEDVLKDITDLLNVKNISGDETFSQDGNTVVWNANGNDIYYQGESKKELPVTFEVKYTLDGKEIEAKDLAGKSGKLSIKIEYTNHEAHEVTVNGKKDTLYTPFVVGFGTVINNDKARNIKINSGKIIDDGSKNIIIGISMPGMQESLGISKDKLEIPSTVEITMDVEDFEMENIVTYITPKLIEESDLSIFDDLDDVYAQVNELKSASTKLVSGSKELKEGTNTLNSGATELKRGIASAKTGAKTIETEVAKSIKTLKNDKTEVIDSKTMAYIKKNAKEQADAAYKKQESAITSQAQSSAVATVKKMLASGKETEISKTVTKEATTGATELITELMKSGVTLTKEQQAIIAKQFGATATSIAGTTATTTAGMVASQVAGQVAKETAQTTATTTAETVAKQVGETAKETFTNQVVSQMGTLDAGLKELVSGLEKLEAGSKNLSNGTSTLNKGAQTLSSGMSEFDKNGISKISNLVNGDVKDLASRLEKLQELSNEYNNFTMANKDTADSVKFIVMMDSIKKSDDTKQEAILNNNEISTSNKEEDK